MADDWDPLRERLRRTGAAAKAAEDHATDAREARDAAIEDADLAGMTAQEIARHVDLARSRVTVIVGEQTAARQAAAKHATGLDGGALDVGA